MNENQKYFEELMQKYTLEEVADAVLLPNDLPEEEEEAKARAEFVAFRMEMHRNRTPEQKLLGKLIRLKYQIRDAAKNTTDSKDKSLSYFLKEYLDISGQSYQDLAKDIDIEAADLCDILNGKEQFGKVISFRLEAHSGDVIPAVYWWRLAKKEEEQAMLQATKERTIEHAKVQNRLLPVKV